MTFRTELEERAKTILNDDWNARAGSAVPHTNDVALKNGAVKIEAAFLYADLAGSTALQKDYVLTFAAKALRMYLAGASSIIRHFEGNIKSFDGDRVMGVFMGDSKCNNAVKAAFAINWLVTQVIEPLVRARHEKNGTTVWTPKHGVGIDVGEAFVVRAGVRNAAGETTHNDLTFTGRAPNVAAKLSALRTFAGSVIITGDVFGRLNAGQKKHLKSEHAVWDGPEKHDVGPYLMQLYDTGYWRSPDA